MRIITTVREIAEALSGLLSVVPKRPTHAVLATVHVETVKEGIQLKASNLQSYLTVFIPCQVLEEGKTCIPAKLFSDIVTKQTKGKNSFGELELGVYVKDELTIVTNSGRQTIKVNDPTEFIDFPQPDTTDKKLTVDGIEFFNKCKTLSNHVSKNEHTGNLAHIHLAGNKLAACDGSKLAFSNLRMSEGSPSILIPPELVPILNKLNLVKTLTELENTNRINITFGIQSYEVNDYLFLNVGNWELIQRTQSYQPLPNFLLDDTTIYSELELDRQHLLSRLKAAIICCGQKSTKLWLHLQKGSLHFLTKNSCDSLTTGVVGDASCLLEAEHLLKIVDSLKVSTIKLRLPHTRNLIGIEVDDINIGLMVGEPKDDDQAILNEFLESIQAIKQHHQGFYQTVIAEPVVVAEEIDRASAEIKQTAVAVLEPIQSEPNVDDKVREAIAHLDHLLLTVTDIQMREAIVREVIAMV
jgi:DNA polymerase III sliding clamp (beta) subunit (PCNA family)